MKQLCKLVIISLIFMNSSIYSMLSSLNHAPTGRIITTMQQKMTTKPFGYCLLKTYKPVIEKIECNNRIEAAAIEVAHKARNKEDWDKVKKLFEMAYIYKHDAVVRSNPNYEKAELAVIAGQFGKARHLLEKGLLTFKEE